MTTYRQFHARSISDPQGFWAEQAALIDWKQPFQQVLDYSTTAVRQMVRRRNDQPVPQRGRSPPRRPRRPGRADLHLDRDRRGKDLHVRPVVSGSEPHGRHPEWTRRRTRRPRSHLHADDSRSRVRDAGVRAHRRDPLGRVRRFRVGQPCHPDRRRAAEGDRECRRRFARRQGGAVQAPARRGHLACQVPAQQRADGEPWAGPRRGGRRSRRRLRKAARRTHERRGAVRVARVERTFVHPLHLRHDRQAQGRAARHRRLRRRARRLDEAHLLRQCRARTTSPPATSAGS